MWIAREDMIECTHKYPGELGRGQTAGSRRRIFYGLVKAYRSDKTTFDGIIASKGRGTVGLPNMQFEAQVGKTCLHTEYFV